MTTNEILAIIATAKTRADVVPAMAALLPPGEGAVNWRAINKAITDKWSPAAREWIITQAWKIVDSRAAQP